MIRHKCIGTIGYLGGIMSLPEPFTWSWGNLLAFSKEALCGPNEYIHPEHATVSLHDWARNDLLTRMRGDWILMLDTDIAFEPDLAARLVYAMNRYDLDVVTGIYSSKVAPHYPVLYMHNAETRKNEVVADWDRESEVMQVDAAGAGVLLVRRRVFERIQNELHENPFDRIGRKGEDVSFFERLRRLGIPAWCAWKIEIQHLAYFGVQTSKHFRPTREPDRLVESLGFDLNVAAGGGAAQISNQGET